MLSFYLRLVHVLLVFYSMGEHLSGIFNFITGEFIYYQRFNQVHHSRDILRWQIAGVVFWIF